MESLLFQQLIFQQLNCWNSGRGRSPMRSSRVLPWIRGRCRPGICLSPWRGARPMATATFLMPSNAGLRRCPARQLTVIGVTGTDGKTTTATLIYHILKAAGLKAGMISTVSALIGVQAIDTGFHVTTPEAPDVQRYLAQMAAAGLTHVVLEATSHGLAQQRVAACDFGQAVVSNII